MSLWRITLRADDVDALRGQQVWLPLTTKILATSAIIPGPAGRGGERTVLVDGDVTDVETMSDAFVTRAGLRSMVEPAPDGRYVDRDGSTVEVRGGRVVEGR
jgi:hypothetical protein